MRPDTQALFDRVFTGDTSLLERALTRRAFLLEQGRPASPQHHHESLEHVGDAWLGAIVSTRLIQAFPDGAEGALSATRSTLVDTTMLAAIAREHDLAAHLHAGVGEVQQGQHLQDAALGAHLEAVIGAAALRGGAQAAAEVIEHLWADRWPDALLERRETNAIGALQERMAQQISGPGLEPDYSLARVEGTPDHAPLFTATVTLPDGRSFTGQQERKKRDAKQSAARAALAVIRAADEALHADIRASLASGDILF